MQHSYKTSLVAAIALMVVSLVGVRADDILISTFGADIQANNLVGTWNAVQNTSSQYDADTGTVTANDDGGGISFGLGSVLNFSQYNFVSLTASVEEGFNPKSNFIISFDDGSDDESAMAVFNWEDFGPTLTTVTVELVRTVAFNDGSVIAWGIVTQGSGSPLKVTLSSMTVSTPEPSSVLLMLLGSGMVFLSQRRRTSRQ